MRQNIQTTNDFYSVYKVWRRLRQLGKPELARQEMCNFWKPALAMLAYIVFYLVSFDFIEKMTRLHYSNIHVVLDDMIPFCELFVIPYFTWFAYMVFAAGFLFMFDRENYHKSATILYIGMTLFIVVSLFWPNIQYLRPDVMPRDNVLTHLIATLYKTDTPTNLCPSIHVFNTLVAMVGVHRCKANVIARNVWYRRVMYTIGVLIILSTMFIKQHSVFDVCCAFMCFGVSYFAVYYCSFSLSGENNTLLWLFRRKKGEAFRRVND